jgi:GH25 family lysozyme M1 (1,4-beta-N-acetylmuramidase)
MKFFKSMKTIAATVLAVVLAVSCVPSRGSQTVHADKGAESAIAWGIDVSAWQGNIDWNAVKAAGVQFAFIKCGGTIYGFDDKFAQNMAGAQAAGIKTGVYIYSYASSVADGYIEAQWIINAIAPYTINMPVVLDLENYRQKALDPLTNAMICTAFCQTVEAAGYYPMVYSNRSMFRITSWAFP